MKLLKEANLVDEYIEEMLVTALRNIEIYEERIVVKEDYFYDEIEIKKLADENFKKIYELIIWLILTSGEEHYKFLRHNVREKYKEIIDNYSPEKKDIHSLKRQ
ncbi:MAG: hypothetical protein MJ191_02730 [Clostridium sp.]|nr:hypothetical protein [Clostridium sp.]